MVGFAVVVVDLLVEDVAAASTCGEDLLDVGLAWSRSSSSSLLGVRRGRAVVAGARDGVLVVVVGVGVVVARAFAVGVLVRGAVLVGGVVLAALADVDGRRASCGRPPGSASGCTVSVTPRTAGPVRRRSAPSAAR